MLSELSQSEREVFHLNELFRVVKFIRDRKELKKKIPKRQKVEWWWPGGGKEGMGSWCLMGTVL